MTSELQTRHHAVPARHQTRNNMNNPEARHTCRPSHESRTRVRILWATMMWVMRCIYMRVPLARMTCSTTAAWSQPISTCICVYLFMHYGCVYAYMYT